MVEFMKIRKKVNDLQIAVNKLILSDVMNPGSGFSGSGWKTFGVQSMAVSKPPVS